MFVTFKHYNTIHSININHIIAVEYQEQRLITEDDETGEIFDPPRRIPPSLKISTSEQVMDEVYSYVGQMIGAIPTSRHYIISGDLATEIFNMLPSVPTVGAR